MITRSCRCVRIQRSARARQMRQSRASPAGPCGRAGPSTAGHADFVSDTTRQPRVFAARSSAGSHWRACESPNKVTRTLPLGFPNTQGWMRASPGRV